MKRERKSVCVCVCVRNESEREREKKKRERKEGEEDERVSNCYHNWFHFSFNFCLYPTNKQLNEN